MVSSEKKETATYGGDLQPTIGLADTGFVELK